VPDGDIVHSKLRRLYQKPYKWLCEGTPQISDGRQTWHLNQPSLFRPLHLDCYAVFSSAFPAKFPFRLLDWYVVDAGKSTHHQTVFSELPVFVAIGSIPET